MISDRALKFLTTFSGKDEDFRAYHEDLKSFAAIYGFGGILDGTVAVPAGPTFTDDEQKIVDLNNLAYHYIKISVLGKAKGIVSVLKVKGGKEAYDALVKAYVPATSRSRVNIMHSYFAYKGNGTQTDPEVIFNDLPDTRYRE
jgi:hypothetical protein